jgi:uncharacterized protein YcgI (DUF1989 family)
MNVIFEHTIPRNTGWTGEIGTGQVLRITATTTVDFILFDKANIRERFDQARTKVYNKAIFISTGHKLMSRSNKHMMTIVEDSWADGTHDLQKGMCSATRFQLAAKEGRLQEYYNHDVPDVPDHGCWENLTAAMSDHNIAPEDLPSPFNLFQHMDIDGKTGVMLHTEHRPTKPEYVDFRAEMDLVLACSACPDLAAIGGGQEVGITIYEP